MILLNEAWLAALLVILILLAKISFDDITKRTVKHRYLTILIVLFMCSWFVSPNYKVLPYTGCILVVGFILHVLGVLGAGDSKLVAVISLGVMPDYISLMLFGAIALGGVLAVLTLCYGLLTDLQRTRAKGIPYAVPISISGGFFIFLSYIDWFGIVS